MNLPRIPKPYHCTTGEQHEAYTLIEGFFTDIQEYIGLNKTKPLETQFEIRHLSHVREDNGQETDDLTHLLLYRSKDYQERVVACVLEIRNEFNNIQFDFFMNLYNTRPNENLPD